MDAFTEQLIQKKKSSKEIGMYVLCGVLGLIALALAVVLFLLFPQFPPFTLIVVIGAGYGIFHLVTAQNIEYEYTVTNGDIDIDQITARRSRQRLVSVAGRKIEMLCPYRAEAFEGRVYDRTVVAVSDPAAEGLWAFSYRGRKNGHTLVIFEPNDRVMKQLFTGLSRTLVLEIKQKYGVEY